MLMILSVLTKTKLSGGLFNLTFYDAIVIYVATQDRLKTVRGKCILKPFLMIESHSAKVLQPGFSDPLSLTT